MSTSFNQAELLLADVAAPAVLELDLGITAIDDSVVRMPYSAGCVRMPYSAGSMNLKATRTLLAI